MLRFFNYNEAGDIIKPFKECKVKRPDSGVEVEMIKSYNKDAVAIINNDEDDVKILKYGVSCDSFWSGYVSFFKIRFGAEEEGTRDEDAFEYVFVPARCVDINNPYEILKDKGIIENSVLFKVDDEKTPNLDWIISS